MINTKYDITRVSDTSTSLIVDIDSVKRLRSRLSNIDIGSVLLLAVKARTEFSILLNNKIPYTSDELQVYLGLKSKSRFISLINKLIAANVLCKFRMIKFNKKETCYIFNPSIARYQNKFNQRIINAFTLTAKDELGNVIYTPSLPDGTITVFNENILP
jgi:hypothetical protein